MSKKRIRGTLIRREGANCRLQHELRQILLHEMELCIIINTPDPYLMLQVYDKKKHVMAETKIQNSAGIYGGFPFPSVREEPLALQGYVQTMMALIIIFCRKFFVFLAVLRIRI